LNLWVGENHERAYGVALVLDLISNINIHDVVLENTATLPGEKPSEDIGFNCPC
jgi:hypothetical protein